MDPVVVDGPPAPDSMAAMVGLSGDGLTRYTTMYQNLMESTRQERDSIATLREARHHARMSGGEGPPAAGGMDGMRAIRGDLESRQREFDRALEEDLLSHDQMKLYRDWRDRRRHEAERRMREMRRPDGDRDGGSPGT
jgi:hypothetical protein